MSSGAKRLIATLAIILTITLLYGTYVAVKANFDPVKILQNPVVQKFLPTWRSFRKILDLPYFVYQIIPDHLPTYEITINPLDLETINKALPDDPIKGRLVAENKVTVRGTFRARGYEERIDIRYRGWVPNHWNALKKSYLIDFPAEHPFNGIKELNLIIPEDRAYAIVALNAHRSKKLGLLVAEPKFVKVKLNGRDIGVYLAQPHWDQSFLETNGRPKNANIYGTEDLTREELKNINFYDPENINLWKDYTQNALTDERDIELLHEFLSFIQNAPEETFRRSIPLYLDMDSFYSWLVASALASSNHQTAQGNIILYNDPGTGRFHPVPWDIGIKNPDPIDLEVHPLVSRMLSIDEFRNEFLRQLRAYVQDPKNKERDLAFYDSVIDEVKIPLYKDGAKLPLNIEAGNDFKRYSNMVLANFSHLEELFNEERESELFINEFIFPERGPFESSSFIREASVSAGEFISANPSFYQIDEDTLGIGPGTFVFFRSVILPYTHDLVIQPNTTILLGQDVSVIAHNSLTARGMPAFPINITSLSGNTWGSLLVLGSPSGTSTINRVTFSGGSSYLKGGIGATGMLAIHGGNAHITNSIFKDSSDDDAFNFKNGYIVFENNMITNTHSDGIDIDVGRGVIRNNTFKNIGQVLGGDAIDTSHSNLEIVDNIVETCTDKGISIGEVSIVNVDDNIISNCLVGISVKDLSEAHIVNTSLVNNEVAIEAKQKKPLFGGGFVEITGLTLEENRTNYKVDQFSEINKK